MSRATCVVRRRLLQSWACSFAALAAASISNNAFAQKAQQSANTNIWVFCSRTVAGRHPNIYTHYFETSLNEFEKVKEQWIADNVKDGHVIGGEVYITCLYQTTLEDARYVESALPNGGYGASFVDWKPSLVPQSAIKSLVLDFEPCDGSGFLHAKHGYKRASIKLNYRFLLCANEIQVAYALDRKSLEHSQDYVDKFTGTNANFIKPPGEPPVPMTVPLALKVYLKKPGSPYVATLRDGTAGEALGMGCFTGQTSRIGLVAKLIGPKATRPEIKSYLDLLDLSGMTTAAEIDSPLLNPAVPAPPAPARRPAVRRKA